MILISFLWICLCALSSTLQLEADTALKTLSAQQLYEIAVSFINENTHDQAAQVLQLALDKEPGNGEYLQLLGSLYVATDPSYAEKVLYAALDSLGWSRASSAAIYGNYIESLRRQGPSRAEDAIAVALKGAELHGSQLNVLFNAAMTLQFTGRFEDAYEIYLRVHDIAPYFEEAWERVRKHETRYVFIC